MNNEVIITIKLSRDKDGLIGTIITDLINKKYQTREKPELLSKIRALLSRGIRKINGF